MIFASVKLCLMGLSAGSEKHRSQAALLAFWAMRTSPEEGILGNCSASCNPVLAGWSVLGVAVTATPPPVLADSLTIPQSCEVGAWALKRRHFDIQCCFNIFVTLSPSTLCLWALFAAKSLRLLLISSKSLATTNTLSFCCSEPHLPHPWVILQFGRGGKIQSLSPGVLSSNSGSALWLWTRDFKAPCFGPFI